MAVRTIVLCADDYAMNEGVSRGILALAQMGRISATSAMTNAPGWPELAKRLDPLAGRIGTGLHLTLTWGGPLGAMPQLAPGGRLPGLRAVVEGSLSGRLPLGEVADEIGRQLDAFRQATGREPDFVDGHQHVHALPGIRQAVLGVLAARGLAGRLWLRDPADRPSAIIRRRVAAPKALLVAALSRGFGAQAGMAGFRTNRGFSGFSPFDPARDLHRDFAACLVAAGPAHLVMCHPGEIGAAEGLDEVVEARRRELDYLRSPAFGRLLAERRIELVPAPA
ncbi:ChbG/HpnK family deacetylase [Enterovirga sp. DB1703]|uniref:ChbG/HpnK family deacetylase n=2 Tax=Enterovirga aerilata TaxID=2730920 RepID=A0A849I4P7_9HYPH|nr:ChbG/HpnK family deacetylase [Enterovirga sp. DB1703]